MRSAGSLASDNACSTARFELALKSTATATWLNGPIVPVSPAPRDQQDRDGCLGRDTLGDRPHTKSVDSAALVRSHHDHVGTERTRVQQDDLRGITLLNPVLEFDVRLFGPLPKLRGQRETLTSVPAERLIQRHRVDHDEFGAVMFTERERVLEGTTRRLREVDRCENARKMIHDAASKDCGGDFVVRTTHRLRGKKGSIDGVKSQRISRCIFKRVTGLCAVPELGSLASKRFNLKCVLNLKSSLPKPGRWARPTGIRTRARTASSSARA